MSDIDDPPLLTASSSLSSLRLASSSVSTSTPATQTPPPATAHSNYGTPTAPVTTATASFTPSANDTQEWNDFCETVNVSPPKRINKTLGQVKREANRILERSRLQLNGSPYTWDSLEGLQQAGMAFIINEGIMNCFPWNLGYDGMATWIAHGVLGRNKVERGKVTINGQSIWRDLHQFVRKRGDRIDLTGNWNTNFGAEKYRQFRSDYKEYWGNERERKAKSCTIFSLNHHIEPVLRFQAEFSMVCAFVVSSLMIHYRQVIYPEGDAPASGAFRPGNQGSKQTRRKSLRAATSRLFTLTSLGRGKARGNSTLGSGPGLGSPPASAPALPPVAVWSNGNAIETKAGNCTLNIGRYMRHNLTTKQKYETIFKGMGFIFEDVLSGLLRMSNASALPGGFLRSIDIHRQRPPEYLFREVEEEVKHGALCARVRLYEGYETKTMCVKEQPEMEYKNDFHFVAVIGASRTLNGQHGGIMFQIQDSLGEPFKNQPRIAERHGINVRFILHTS